MKKDHRGTYHEYEYKVELSESLSSSQKFELIQAIKESPLYFRSYTLQGNTWHELRRPDNQDVHKAPNCSLLIGSDYIYLMRDLDELWKGLDTLKAHLSGKVNDVRLLIQ